MDEHLKREDSLGLTEEQKNIVTYGTICEHDDGHLCDLRLKALMKL
jgi:surface antigen